MANSYKLGLKGAGVNVQTGCSSSLVGVHLARQSLLNNECDMAIVGASSIVHPIFVGHMHETNGIMSPDGKCRAFDADAKGYNFICWYHSIYHLTSLFRFVKGNGVALVVLKKYNTAVRDKDNILAVIKGTAVNNDGSAKVSYTAPSIEGQSHVIKDALRAANVDPHTITCIFISAPHMIYFILIPVRLGSSRNGNSIRRSS